MQQGFLAASWVRRETGQDLVEYALIVAFVALVIVGALSLFGGDLQAFYGRILSGLPFGS